MGLRGPGGWGEGGIYIYIDILGRWGGVWGLRVGAGGGDGDHKGDLLEYAQLHAKRFFSVPRGGKIF